MNNCPKPVVAINRKTKIILCLTLIAALTRIIYYPSGNGKFLNWDDNAYVTENFLIRDLSFEGIKTIFTSFHHGLYKPLVFFSFALEFHFFGLNPQAFHINNVILHLLNCMLVFMVILLITHDYRIACICSLLFGIHPLHVESVAWITERKDVLYSLFFLSAFVLYILHGIKSKTSFYYLSLLSFLFSLLAKPMAVTLPGVLLLWEYLQGKSPVKSRVIRIVPFTILALVIAGINWFGLHLRLMHKVMPVSFSLDSILIAAHGILFYLKKTFWPFGLSAIYPYPAKIDGMFPIIFYSAPFTVLLLLLLTVLTHRYTKKVIFGFLFFFFTLTPVLFLSPGAPGLMAADRYTYIPLIGIFYLIGETIIWLIEKLNHKNTIIRTGFYVTCFFLKYFLSLLSFQRVQIWKNDESLWKNALKAYPFAFIPNYQLGEFYLAQGDIARANTYAHKCLVLYPRLWFTYALLARIAFAQGNTQEAINQFKNALSQQESPRIYNDLAAVYYSLNQYDTALDTYQKALAIDENNYVALLNRAQIYSQKGMKNEALPIIEKINTLFPKDSQVKVKSAAFLLHLNEPARAEQVLHDLLSQNPKSWEALVLLSLLHSKRGNKDKAQEFFLHALKLNPNALEFLKEQNKN